MQKCLQPYLGLSTIYVGLGITCGSLVILYVWDLIYLLLVMILSDHDHLLCDHGLRLLHSRNWNHIHFQNKIASIEDSRQERNFLRVSLTMFRVFSHSDHTFSTPIGKFTYLLNNIQSQLKGYFVLYFSRENIWIFSICLEIFTIQQA